MAEEVNNKGLFVERKHVTLGVKLVVTFAMTYYILYFLLLSYIVITYNTISLKTLVIRLWLIITRSSSLCGRSSSVSL